MRFNIDLSEIENIDVLKDRGFEFFGESYGPSLEGEKFGNFSVVGDSVVHHPLTNKEVLVYQLEDGNGAKVFVQNPAEAVNSETKVQGNGVVFDGVKIDGEVRFLNQDRPILLAGDISVDGKAEVGRDVVINESMKLILEGERIINFDRDVDVFYSKNGFTISNAQEVPEFGIDSSAVELRGLENLSKGDSVVEGKLVSVKADIENISSMANYLAPILKEELSQARDMSFGDIYDGIRSVPGGTAVLKEIAKEIKEIYKPQLEVKDIEENKKSPERKGGVSL